MSCYSPLEGWRSNIPNAEGKRPMVFSVRARVYPGEFQRVPCGHCVGCRLDRSRDWAIRSVHEASLYSHNCFLTLTFSPENLPRDMSLDKSVFQKFMKRLRRSHIGLSAVTTDRGVDYPIRYYMCGEYGDQFGRPHYHVCLFNFDFLDKKLFKKSGDNFLYVSDELSRLWPFGWSYIGDVTFQSAAYVARYIMKKQTGGSADEYYEFVDDYGEVHDRLPEYNEMSRSPGLGRYWFDRFGGDVYPSDACVHDGRSFPPPRYYDFLFERSNPLIFEEIKQRRLESAKVIELTDRQLYTGMQVKQRKLDLLLRSFE